MAGSKILLLWVFLADDACGCYQRLSRRRFFPPPRVDEAMARVLPGRGRAHAHRRPSSSGRGPVRLRGFSAQVTGEAEVSTAVAMSLPEHAIMATMMQKVTVPQRFP
jgi:hypothetical protein